MFPILSLAIHKTIDDIYENNLVDCLSVFFKKKEWNGAQSPFMSTERPCINK